MSKEFAAMKEVLNKPIGSLVIKDNGSIDVHYHSSTQKDIELFELAYKYVFYSLTKMDWMQEYADMQEIQEKEEKIKKPNLKIIK